MEEKEAEFKEKFIERFSKLTDFDQFKEYSLRYPKSSIRVNTLKIGIDELYARISDTWEIIPVPWCSEGFFIRNYEGRRDIGNLTEHSLGYFFVQEASAMLPVIALSPKPGDFVLDMCASPGAKTTQIAQYKENKGLIIANDYKRDRNKALALNIQRCGVLNTVMTLGDSRRFKGFQFDKILLDAPCSGTGTIRKSLKTLRMWNPNMVRRLCITQKELINTAFNNLKPGGVMVYSTCSVEPEENEGVVSFLLEKYADAVTEKPNLNITQSEPIKVIENKTLHEGVENCVRIWPQDNDTDGFFLCRIRKKDV
ncbi:MAG: NOL1/NOP2/sun family putative RNA methylase [Candidatus Nanoarchaeia archaeon]